MRYIHRIFLLTLFLYSCDNPSENQVVVNQEIIKFGVYETPPRIDFDEKGNPEGIYIDLINEILKGSHKKVEYVHAEFKELIYMLEKGEIDFLPLRKTKDRDSIFDFTSQPIIRTWLEVFTTKKTKIGGVKDFDGKILGVLDGSAQVSFVRDTLQHNLNISYTVKTYKRNTDIIAGLKKNEIDVAIISRFFYLSILNEKEVVYRDIVLGSTDIHFAFTKNKHSELIDFFDRKISSLSSNPNSVYYSSTPYWITKYSEKGQKGVYPVVTIIFIILTISIFLIYKLVRHNIEKGKVIVLKHREILEAKLEAERSNRLKTVFLQNMSHEIRTPLNGILGFTDILKDDNLSFEDKALYNNIIKMSSERLLNTINDIIDISKIESEQITLNETAVDTRELMHFIYNFFKEQAIGKGVLLEISEQLDEDMAVIETDKSLLTGTLINLIKNAIKYTPEGEIIFGNYLKNNYLYFYVKDTGIGIPEDQFEEIFKPFRRIGDAKNLAEGSGLGLSISKSFVEKLGGEIWVATNEAAGVTFYFRIPYKSGNLDINKTEKYSSESYELVTSKKLKILVAEDDTFSYLVIKKFLDFPNIRILHAKNGLEAVKIFEDIKDLSMAILDIRMPKLSGFDVAKHIREKDNKIPIIIQSAYVQSDDEKLAIALGCNAFISKPTSKKTLISTINKLVSEIV